jgi:hypothetical protein
LIEAVPPEIVVPPPVAHGVEDQPVGTVVPENSAPTVGLRMTSPSEVAETYVLAPVVPAPKSVVVVSVNEAGAETVRKVHVTSAPSVLPDVSAIELASVMV